jgi:hypothetical protein
MLKISCLSSLTLCSLLYLLILTYDHVKRGRRISLFRYIRLQRGRLIVPNTLYLYVILVACGGIGLTCYTVQTFRCYILGASLENLSIIGSIAWIWPILAGWIFAFSVVSASLRAKGAYFGGSPVTIHAHNILLFLVPCSYLGVSIVRHYKKHRYERRTNTW